MTKICTKCKQEKSVNEFRKHKRYKNGIYCWCKNCCRSYDRKYHKTLNGYLRQVFYDIKTRCNNSKARNYKWYGGRGIRILFKSVNEFVDYVINTLGYNTYDKIKGLQIDRIDNNGHYEKGNIRLVTQAKNLQNKRKKYKKT